MSWRTLPLRLPIRVSTSRLCESRSDWDWSLQARPMSVGNDRRWDFRVIVVLGVVGWMIAMLALGGTLSATFVFLLISFLLFYLPGNLVIGHHLRTVSSASVVLSMVVGLAVSVTVYSVLRVVATDMAVVPTFAVLALGGFLRLVGAIRASSLFTEPNTDSLSVQRLLRASWSCLSWARPSGQVAHRQAVGLVFTDRWRGIMFSISLS